MHRLATLNHELLFHASESLSEWRRTLWKKLIISRYLLKSQRKLHSRKRSLFAANGRFTLSAATAAKERKKASVGKEHVKCNEEKCKLRYIVCFPIKKIEGEMLSGGRSVLPTKSFFGAFTSRIQSRMHGGGEKSVKTFSCESFGFVIFWLKGMTWVKSVLEWKCLLNGLI